jgi:hypothetical protein
MSIGCDERDDDLVGIVFVQALFVVVSMSTSSLVRLLGRRA